MPQCQFTERDGIYSKSFRAGKSLETCRKMESSLCLIGMFSYSAALEMISIKPRIFVLLLSDMLNSSVYFTANSSLLAPSSNI